MPEGSGWPSVATAQALAAAPGLPPAHPLPTQLMPTPRTRPPGRAALLLLACLGGCAPAVQREQAYVAPTEHSVTTRLEAAYDGRGQHVVVENNSTVDLVATSLHLRDCKNIRNPCQVHRMRVPLRAGQRVRLATVEVRDTERPSSFRYSWTWQVARPAPTPAP